MKSIYIASVILSLIPLFGFASEDVEIISLNAQYVVPASQASEEYSFEMPQYLIVDGPDDADSMHIVLPMELVGHGKIISLDLISKNGTHRSFSSAQGFAECEGKWKELKCDIQFLNLEIDIASRDEYIRNYTPVKDHARLQAVAFRFGTDPIGKVFVLGSK